MLRSDYVQIFSQCSKIHSISLSLLKLSALLQGARCQTLSFVRIHPRFHGCFLHQWPRLLDLLECTVALGCDWYTMVHHATPCYTSQAGAHWVWHLRCCLSCNKTRCNILYLHHFVLDGEVDNAGRDLTQQNSLLQHLITVAIMCVCAHNNFKWMNAAMNKFWKHSSNRTAATFFRVRFGQLSVDWSGM